MPKWERFLLARNTRKRLFILFVAAILCGLIGVIVRGVQIETDILKLIPQSRASMLSEIAEQFSRSQTGEMVFLLTARTDSGVVALANQTEYLLQKSALFGSINGKISEQDQREWYDLYFPFRHTLLPDQLRTELESDHPGESLTRHLQRNLYAPIPDFYGSTLQQDPFQLFPSFMQTLFDGNADLIDGYGIMPFDSLSSIVITVTLAGSPFDNEVQKSSEQLVAAIKTLAAKNGGQCRSTGIVRFAGEAFLQAKKEISIIGTLSLLAVILMLLAAFRSCRLLLVGTLPILLGVITGFVATALINPNIHVIALTMGASLTGIAIDYSLHFLAHLRWTGDSSAEVLKKIFPGITLGAVTTLIGYGALAFGGFPGLQQIALFTGAGLIGSWITVILGFPLMIRAIPARVLKPMPAFSPTVVAAFRVIVPAGLLAISIAGLMKLTTDDSLNALRTPMPQLDREEASIRTVAAGIESSRFVVITANSEEELLVESESAVKKLKSLVNDSVLDGFISLSTFVPSHSSAIRGQSLLRKGLADNNGSTRSELISLGFDSSVLSVLDSSLNDPRFLTLDQFMASPVSKPWRTLLVKTDSTFAMITLLRDVHDSKRMQSVFRGDRQFYLDRIESISSVLGNYRHDATNLVIIAYLLILIILIVRYGIWGGVRQFVPPVLAATAVIGGLSLAGESINFMHIMALLLVLGIGIDYTVFFAEEFENHNETRMAVILSALSTILAFGVLFLSSTPALRAIGLVITPGILLSVILAILFQKKSGKNR